jgi:pimeloyl-ACP methyl ester carboxylesterase
MATLPQTLPTMAILANTACGGELGVMLSSDQEAIQMATILFLHGWRSVPGGVKPTYLKHHGHTVINPALDDNDFAAAVRTAQEALDQLQPQVVVGSSRGGAVAMNIDSGDTPLVLLCPAWKNWGTAKTVRPDTVSLQPTVRLVQKWAKSGSQWSIARRRAWIGGVPGSEACLEMKRQGEPL